MLLIKIAENQNLKIKNLITEFYYKKVKHLFKI